MSIKFLLFDLDETLYPRDSGVMTAIGRLIRQFMVDHMGYSWDEAQALARRYYLEHGTAMRGLVLYHNLDVDQFLEYVHNLPLEQLLVPNPQLATLLDQLPAEKVIFTNADRAHAERVLDRLGIRHHFTHIIDIIAVNLISKPNPDAYLHCLKLLDTKPEDCVLIEDSARNLAPAAAMGMTTVLVDGERNDHTHYYIDDILELGPIIEAICQQQLA